MPPLLDDYPSDTSTTGRFSIGNPAHGQFENYSDTDWYAITLQTGTNYLLSLTVAAGSESLGLYDAQGAAVVPVVASTTYMPAINYTPTLSGTYYVAAHVGGYKDLGYTITAAERTGADDYGTSAASAGTLNVNGVTNANFEVAGDHDWLAFHAVAGEHYVFSAKGDGIANATYSSSGVNGNAIRALVVDANGAPAATQGPGFNPVVTGDYYLDLYGLHAGAYAVTATRYNDDYPATYNAAGPLVAGLLVPGGHIDVLSQFAFDVDTFKVTLEEGQYYAFSFGAAAAQFSMAIGDASGELMSTWDGRFEFGPGLVFHAPASGDYYVATSNTFGPPADGAAVPYTISASVGLTDLVGNTPATAATAIVGATTRGALEDLHDIDYYKMALQAQTRYTISFAPDSIKDFGLGLQLVDGAGNTLAGVGGAGSAYTFSVPSDGNYYAYLHTSTHGLDNLLYSFRLTAAALPPVADDIGADAAGARAMAVGAAAGGALEQAYDHDWFALQLTAGTTYGVVLDGRSLTGMQVRVLDANGAQVAAGVAGTTLAWLAERSGPYYIDVSSSANAIGAYSVTASVGMRDDFGSTPATAGALSPAAPVKGQLELANDTDMFALAVTAGATYSLTAASAATYAPAIALTDANGAAIAQLGWSVSKPAGTVLFTAPASGVIYASLSNSNGSSPGIYTLSEVAYGPDDIQGDASSAATLAVGNAVHASLSHPLDADWIRVALEAGKSYVFDLLGAPSGGGTLAATSALDFWIDSVLYGPSLPRPTVLNGVEQRIAFTPATSGDYFLKVGGYAYTAALGSYSVTASELHGSDVVGPTLLAMSPAPGATGISLGSTTLTFTFSEAITFDTAAMTVTDGAGALLQFPHGLLGGLRNAHIDGATLTIQLPEALQPGTFTVSLPHAAVHDLAGNRYTGPETLTFATVPTVALATAGNDLLRGATGAAIDAGAGVDMVVYPHTMIGYQVSRAGGVTRVFDIHTGLTDTLVNVERVLFGDQAFAYDVDGNGGQVYRLYQAAFHRTPDQGGVGFWIAQMDKGAGLRDVATAFVGSAEFTALYGAAPSDNAFLTALYSNVLHRAPDAGGFEYWSTAMHNGGTRAGVLQQFSESAENQVALVAMIANGFTYSLY